MTFRGPQMSEFPSPPGLKVEDLWRPPTSMAETGLLGL